MLLTNKMQYQCKMVSLLPTLSTIVIGTNQWQLQKLTPPHESLWSGTLWNKYCLGKTKDGWVRGGLGHVRRKKNWAWGGGQGAPEDQTKLGDWVRKGLLNWFHQLGVVERKKSNESNMNFIFLYHISYDSFHNPYLLLCVFVYSLQQIWEVFVTVS